MAAWTLTDKEREALDALRLSARDARLARNAGIILLSTGGRSKFKIAEMLGCSPATVDIVRRRYRRQGLAGLPLQKPRGRISRATPEYRAALRKAVTTPPHRLGYGFNAWTAARLAKHLEKKTKIKLSDDRVRALLAEEGFSFRSDEYRDGQRTRGRPRGGSWRTERDSGQGRKRRLSGST